MLKISSISDGFSKSAHAKTANAASTRWKLWKLVTDLFQLSQFEFVVNYGKILLSFRLC